MSAPLPSGWQTRRLGDLAVDGPTNGYSGPTAPDAEGTPTLRLSATTSGSLILNASTTKRLAETVPPESDLWLQPGDLLVQRSNTPDLVGTAAVYDGPSETYVYPDLMMRLRLPDPATTAWVCRYMNSPAGRRFFSSMAAGSSGSMPKISGAKLREMPVPLPPLPEQRRIAAILDEADNLRRKRRESLALLDDLLRATFLDMFGDPVTNPWAWEAMLLGDIADVQGGLQVTAQRTEPLEVPYLRVANVYRDRLDLREIKTIRVTPAERERVRLQNGDVLVVEGHGNPDEVGRAAVWDRAEEMLHQNHLIRVRANGARLDSVYLSAFLNSQGGRRQMVRAGKTTSGLNTISTSNVKATTVLLPPLSRQRQWSDFVRACSAEHQRAERHVAHVDALCSALLLRAFSGVL